MYVQYIIHINSPVSIFTILILVIFLRYPVTPRDALHLRPASHLAIRQIPRSFRDTTSLLVLPLILPALLSIPRDAVTLIKSDESTFLSFVIDAGQEPLLFVAVTRRPSNSAETFWSFTSLVVARARVDPSAAIKRARIVPFASAFPVPPRFFHI